MTKQRALGRGINSLMGSIDAYPQREQDSHLRTETSIVGSIAEIPLDQIIPNPENPRKEFPESYIEELAQSIRQLGIIQPITLRRINGTYQIISGECRWRAAKIAGLTKIPAYIRVATDTESLEMAVVENVQRKDLNPIEIALHYQAMIEGCNQTQEQLSERIGKSRSAIANTLRLLKLPAEIQLALRGDLITMGHAKPLIALTSEEDQILILRQIMDKDLSVRQVESLCRQSLNPTSKTAKAPKTTDKILQRIEQETTQHLNLKVEIQKGRGPKGTLKVHFNNQEDLDRLMQLLRA